MFSKNNRAQIFFAAAVSVFKKISIAVRSFRRESQNGFGYAADWFVRRFYYRCWLARQFSPKPGNGEAASARPLSVVVPAVEKDAAPLRRCLAAANRMLRHPLPAKWVVGPESAELRAIAAEAGWEFVPEDKILPRPAKELKCRGWLLQQFIKLNAANHVPTEDYLVLDADTLFLRPQNFFRGGKTVLRYADQYELLYNRSLELIFGSRRRFPVSFVTHHMVFGRKDVREILELIESRFGKRWWEAILQEVDQGHLISFSEYELYGNHIVARPQWRKEFVLEHWHGLDKYTQDFPQFLENESGLAGRYNSVSFHHHTQ